MSETASPSALSELARLVRRHDRDRFLTALFAPEAQRRGLLALYAFNYEVAKTREVVSEPTLGRIRLQWWRDSLDAIYAGVAARRPEVLQPLADAIRRHALTRRHLDALIDARERDLDDAPPTSLAALEAYAEETSAPLVLLALEALGASGEATERAGRAVGIGYALTGLLRAIPFHARARRCYLPRALCVEAGVDVDRGLFELRPGPGLAQVVEPIAARAAAHLAAAGSLRPGVPRQALPALLPAVLAGADLARLRRCGYDPFAASFAARDPWRAWRLSFAALRGRY
jgi:NADH dehydrogenase [ubiquinone] 1 alpha subcomplex assembly factor 6